MTFFSMQNESAGMKMGKAYVMKEIGSEEVSGLKNCLEELAEHHNRVSVNFKGCYPKQPFEETLMRFASDVETGRSSIAVMEADDRVFGFCKINYGDAVGVLEYLIVSENYRGKGYGAQLMGWALSRFEELGIHDIDVKVADGNDAIFLYEKYGFKMNAHILLLSR